MGEANSRTIDDVLYDLVVGDKEAAEQHLKDLFIESVVTKLARARSAAGLSQAELAVRLRTTQSVISRTERDYEGAFSLHRIADWLFACDMAPQSLEIQPFSLARRDALALLRPQEPQREQPSALIYNSRESIPGSLFPYPSLGLSAKGGLPDLSGMELYTQLLSRVLEPVEVRPESATGAPSDLTEKPSIGLLDTNAGTGSASVTEQEKVA